jgi:molybdopterin synthase catalytic subunit
MVKPVHDDTKLAHVEDLSYDELRPEFKSAMEGLIKRVLSRPKLKTVHGKHFTGAMLLGLAIEYVDAINE